MPHLGRLAHDAVEAVMDVLITIRNIDPDPPVILLTAHSSVEKAVEAMQKGAYHYARKPFNLDDVAVLVEKALETTRLRREVRALQARDRELHMPLVSGRP